MGEPLAFLLFVLVACVLFAAMLWTRHRRGLLTRGERRGAILLSALVLAELLAVVLVAHR